MERPGFKSRICLLTTVPLGKLFNLSSLSHLICKTRVIAPNAQTVRRMAGMDVHGAPATRGGLRPPAARCYCSCCQFAPSICSYTGVLPLGHLRLDRCPPTPLGRDPAPCLSALSPLVLPSLVPALACDSGPICQCSCPHGAFRALWVSWDPSCALGQQPSEVRNVWGPGFLELGSWQ